MHGLGCDWIIVDCERRYVLAGCFLYLILGPEKEGEICIVNVVLDESLRRQGLNVHRSPHARDTRQKTKRWGSKESEKKSLK